ncbi:hypothetical protein JXI42_10960 [bacterium]|nr:hypothetical protein [bacterium]
MSKEFKSIEEILGFVELFGKDLESPRDNVIESICMFGLYGSNERDRFTCEEIADRIKEKGNLPEIRIQVINQYCSKLVKKGYANVVYDKRELNGTYFLTKKGNLKIKKTYGNTSGIIKTAENKFICSIGTEITITEDEEKTIIGFFRNLMFEVFSKYGRQCTKIITGTITSDEFLGTDFAIKVFQNCLEMQNINNDELSEILRIEMGEVLKGSEEEYRLLVFALIKNFYMLNLIGVASDSNALTKEAYENLKVYLDSNVYIMGLLEGTKHAKAFKELLHIGSSFNMEFVMTNLTQREVYGTGIKQEEKLLDYVFDMPEIAKEKIKDPWLTSFIKAKYENKELTAAEFLEPYKEVRDNLDEFGIKSDYYTEYEALLEDPNTLKLADHLATVYSQAHGTSNPDKTPTAAKHDAFILRLISEYRKKGEDVIFITLDHTLPYASVKLDLEKSKRPLVMTVDNFLQSISPFLTLNTAEDFVTVFSRSFGSYFLPYKEVLNVEEIKFFQDLEIDLHKLSEEQLGRLRRLIREKILEGKPYSHDYLHDVLYKVNVLVKKYLREGEHKDIIINKLQSSVSLKEQEIESLKTDLSDQNKTIKDQKNEISDLSSRLKKIENTLAVIPKYIIGSVVSFVGLALFLFFSDKIPILIISSSFILTSGLGLYVVIATKPDYKWLLGLVLPVLLIIIGYLC